MPVQSINLEIDILAKLKQNPNISQQVNSILRAHFDQKPSEEEAEMKQLEQEIKQKRAKYKQLHKVFAQKAHAKQQLSEREASEDVRNTIYYTNFKKHGSAFNQWLAGTGMHGFGKGERRALFEKWLEQNVQVA